MAGQVDCCGDGGKDVCEWTPGNSTSDRWALPPVMNSLRIGSMPFCCAGLTTTCARCPLDHRSLRNHGQEYCIPRRRR
ncbi:hypothetical protein KC340_g82 [Hortaea werneckii]|nr:hypothetical protein KC340_g82 [Hortaea werneckii]